ncbi:hypothetical protein SDC9_208677 [bioreactor metagenome]|uniref:Uncharacterized protein n=1 Tax=bioreactor metagenome TaxID=1076179 RepID=A0A645JKU8_9ZZZZ
MFHHEFFALVASSQNDDGDAKYRDQHADDLHESEGFAQEQVAQDGGQRGCQRHDQHGDAGADFDEGLEQEHIPQNKADQPGNKQNAKALRGHVNVLESPGNDQVDD